MAEEGRRGNHKSSRKRRVVSRVTNSKSPASSPNRWPQFGPPPSSLTILPRACQTGLVEKARVVLAHRAPVATLACLLPRSFP
jgi:hypothetical protein